MVNDKEINTNTVCHTNKIDDNVIYDILNKKNIFTHKASNPIHKIYVESPQQCANVQVKNVFFLSKKNVFVE